MQGRQFPVRYCLAKRSKKQRVRKRSKPACIKTSAGEHFAHLMLHQAAKSSVLGRQDEMPCILLRILSPLFGPDLLHSLGLLDFSLHRLPVSSEICNAKKAHSCLAGLGQQMIHILLLPADTDGKPLHETSPSVKPESGRMSRKKPG